VATDDLIADLRLLGRSAQPAPASTTLIVDAVLTRLADVPTPSSRTLRHRMVDAVARRRRRVLIAIAVVLLGCLGVPPVRAAVADWFTFDGVRVRLDPAHPTSTARPSPPPTVTGGLSLDQARRLVTFRPISLPALGVPSGVEVSADRRLLSMSWTGPDGSPVRLDEFDGRLDYQFAKTATGVQFTMVGAQTALWFDRPHEVVVLDANGKPRTATPRLAGHTLIWEDDGTVLRLEGSFTFEQALDAARSAQPVP
jgi:hypothetical protein